MMLSPLKLKIAFFYILSVVCIQISASLLYDPNGPRPYRAYELRRAGRRSVILLGK